MCDRSKGLSLAWAKRKRKKSMKIPAFAVVALVVGCGLCRGDAAPAAGPHTVLVEAEAFSATGGWVIDPQFMDQMGSPYLLAHGLGRPVKDAFTTVRFPAAGTYAVLVRTKDWVAQWKAPGTPGRFQLLINGIALKTTFGTEGAEWHWQRGGTVDVKGDLRLRIALHDLTGFEGRCDAILFTTEAGLAPPNAAEAMSRFRRALLGYPEQVEAQGEFDLVVVGGGIAGTCAALSAGRLGLKVALAVVSEITTDFFSTAARPLIELVSNARR